MRHPAWAYKAGADLGILPTFLDLDDPRPAKLQLNEHYAHGGGWRPFKGFVLLNTDIMPSIQYPGDPPYTAIAYTYLRREGIFLFPHAWVMIMQPDGTFEISRMD